VAPSLSREELRDIATRAANQETTIAGACREIERRNPGYIALRTSIKAQIRRAATEIAEESRTQTQLERGNTLPAGADSDADEFVRISTGTASFTLTSYALGSEASVKCRKPVEPVYVATFPDGRAFLVPRNFVQAEWGTHGACPSSSFQRSPGKSGPFSFASALEWDLNPPVSWHPVPPGFLDNAEFCQGACIEVEQMSRVLSDFRAITLDGVEKTNSKGRTVLTWIGLDPNGRLAPALLCLVNTEGGADLKFAAEIAMPLFYGWALAQLALLSADGGWVLQRSLVAMVNNYCLGGDYKTHNSLCWW
jgi:hypothetical protein